MKYVYDLCFLLIIFLLVVWFLILNVVIYGELLLKLEVLVNGSIIGGGNVLFCFKRELRFMV